MICAHAKNREFTIYRIKIGWCALEHKVYICSKPEFNVGWLLFPNARQKAKMMRMEKIVKMKIAGENRCKKQKV